MKLAVVTMLALGSTAFAEESTISGTPGKGLTVRYGDLISTNLRTRIQLRYQLHEPPADSADQIVGVGTARIYFSGHVYDPKLTYTLQLGVAARDYRDNATSPIFDAFLDYKFHRDLSLRVGQHFVPFDRLRTVREFALQLTDRPRIVGEFTLDRDTGIVIYSDSVGGSPVAYRVGAFGGGGTNVTTREPGGLFVGRVEVRPLGPIDDDSEGDLARREDPGLAIGAAVATNRNSNRVKSTTGALFTDGTADYVHAALDLTFKWQGIGLQAEYLYKRAADPVTTMDPADPRERSGRGWVVQASYVLPHPIELVARFSRMSAPGGTDPKFITEVRALGQELAGGVTYYVHDHALKLQLGWIVRSPRDFEFATSDHLVHAQVDATF